MLSRGLSNISINDMNFFEHLKNDTKLSYNICNLETPLIFDQPLNCNKFFIEYERTYFLDFFSAVSLANNHIFDQGIEGLFSTIEILEKKNILFTGAGRTKTQAYKPIQIIKKDYTINVFSLTSKTIVKGNHSLYDKHVALIEEKDEISSAIKKCKLNNEIVVVMVHLGTEYVTVPSKSVKHVYKELIDIGADILIGGHPHVVQGFEMYRNKPIFYSLGDFIFDKLYKNRARSLQIIIDSNDISDIDYILLEKCSNYVSIPLKKELSDKIINRLSKRINGLTPYLYTYVIDKTRNQVLQMIIVFRQKGFRGIFTYFMSKIKISLRKINK